MFKSLFSATLILSSFVANAETFNYDISRIIVNDTTTEETIISDELEAIIVPTMSNITLDNVQNISGNLTVNLAESGVIEDVSFDAELCLPCEINSLMCMRECYVFSDYVGVETYTYDGRIYTVRSNVSGAIYDLNIIRRGIYGSDDPSFIFQFSKQIENRNIAFTLIYKAIE